MQSAKFDEQNPFLFDPIDPSSSCVGHRSLSCVTAVELWQAHFGTYITNRLHSKPLGSSAFVNTKGSQKTIQKLLTAMISSTVRSQKVNAINSTLKKNIFCGLSKTFRTSDSVSCRQKKEQCRYIPGWQSYACLITVCH